MTTPPSVTPPSVTPPQATPPSAPPNVVADPAAGGDAAAGPGGGRPTGAAAHGATVGPVDSARGGWLRRAAGHGYWAAPAGLMLLLGLWRLTGPGLWRDEVITWTAATRPLRDLIRTLRGVDGVFGPYYLLMHGWTTLFGDSEAALRLPSVLAMAAAAGVVAGTGRQLLDRRAGALAGTAFALIPAVSRYAQEARPYALATLLAATATLLLIRNLAAPTGRRWRWYAVAVAGAGLLHLFAFTALLAHAAAVAALARHDRRLLRGWLLAAGAACLAVAPVALVGLRQQRQVSWLQLTSWPTVTGYPAALTGAATLGGVLLALALLGAGGGNRRLRWVAGGLAATPFLALAVAGLTLHLFHPRYLVLTLAGWAVLIGAALATAGPRSRYPLLVVVLLLGWPAHQQVRSADGHSDGGLREAAALITAGHRPGDGVLYENQGWLRLGVDYYLPAGQRPRDVLLTRSPADRGSYLAGECPDPGVCLAGVRRLWVVCASVPPDPAACLTPVRAAALRASYHLVGRTRTGTLIVARYEGTG